MGILKDIRQQQPHIREIFMWVSVVITFSVIGYFGFRNVGSDFVAMVDPDRIEQKQDTAIAEVEIDSPFALIGDTFGDLGATISGVFTDNEDDTIKFKNNNVPVPPQRLPTN